MRALFPGWRVPLSGLFWSTVRLRELHAWSARLQPIARHRGKYLYTMWVILYNFDAFSEIEVERVVFRKVLAPRSRSCPPAWSPSRRPMYKPPAEHQAVYHHSHQWSPPCGPRVLRMQRGQPARDPSPTTTSSTALSSHLNRSTNCLHVLIAQIGPIA